MIVTRDTFQAALDTLKLQTHLGLDTETTGLRMYHGHRLFSIILATPLEAFYFNFNYLEDHLGECAPTETILNRDHLHLMDEVLFSDVRKVWFIQNAANFDLPILARDQIILAGGIHCTKAIGRVVRNDEPDYSLEYQLKQIGLEKSDLVAQYVEKHKLYDKVSIPGKAQQDKLMHYERVPFSVMAPYGETDGTGVAALGMHQLGEIEKESDFLDKDLPAWKTLANVMHNERRLQKTIFRMKEVGVQIDTAYCEKAIHYENDRAGKAKEEFKKLTGQTFKQSPKLFEAVFADDRDNWSFTEKGNPSFDWDAIQKLQSPAAKEIVKIRDAKSKADFYQGFLYHADERGVLHPNYNPEGAIHGRFSSSQPNFQNLTNQDDEEQIEGEFIVRRAIIPRPGYLLIMPDFDQMEYKFALELACIYKGELTEFGKMIVSGFDFHDATGARVKDVSGREFPRKLIKNANFLTLYGGGDARLAETLQIPLAEARAVRSGIKRAIPEINRVIWAMTQTAEEKRFVTNWFGRRSYFANKRFSYKACNYLVSGGCADIVKLAMNKIDAYLKDYKSRMIMTVHDELPIEVHESEVDFVPKAIHAIMEETYNHKYIPLTVGMKFSLKSLGDKVKGYPV